jgi:hypothetical protein
VSRIKSSYLGLASGLNLLAEVDLRCVSSS